MSLLFFGPDVLDYELESLRLVAGILDAARADYDRALAGVTEESPLHESVDDLSGLGFVACQKYVTAIAASLRVDRAAALAAGPRTPSGESLASLVNAAANTWKHQAEWPDPLTGREVRTVERLAHDLDEHSWDYKYVNALHAAAPSGRFSDVADRLAEWRDDLLRTYRRPAR